MGSQSTKSRLKELKNKDFMLLRISLNIPMEGFESCLNPYVEKLEKQD